MIQNFEFPGTTLRQEFEEASTGTTATLSVAVLGEHFITHRTSAANEAVKLSVDYDMTSGAAVTAYPVAIKNAELLDFANMKAVVRNALVQYDDSITADATISGKVITFTGTAKTTFESLPCEVGDKVVVTIGTTKTIATIIAKGADTITIDETLSGTIAKLQFGRTYPDDIDVTLSNKSASGFTIPGGITVLFTELSDTALPVITGDFYLDCRERSMEYVGKVGSVTSDSEFELVLGTPCKDNPLSAAAYSAAMAAKGVSVYFTAVRENTLAAYEEALGVLDNYRVYSIVPATSDTTIRLAVHAHEVAISEDEETKEYRSSWLSLDIPEEIVKISGEECTISSTTITFANAVFYHTPWKQGDVVRQLNASGAKVEDRRIVSGNQVDTVTIEAAFTSTAGTLSYQVVSTNPDNSDIVDALIAMKAVASYKTQVVFADDIEFNGEVLPNYFGAAAAAGMRSYEPCHRPISNLSYGHFTLRNAHAFTREQLKRLGANGIWIIGNNPDGIPVNLRQVTSEASNNLNKDEESIIANVDDIAYTLSTVGEDQVGNSNITPELLIALEQSLRARMNTKLLNNSGSAYIGPQLLSWELEALYQDTVNLDRVYARISCQPPKPFNRFHLVIRVI